MNKKNTTTSVHYWGNKGYTAYPPCDMDSVTKAINNNSFTDRRFVIPKFDSYGNPAVSYPPSAKFDDSEITTNPNHYKQGKISPIEYIEANNLGFCEANVVKYITRHKFKNGKEDVLKAIRYCEFILKYQYKD